MKKTACATTLTILKKHLGIAANKRERGWWVMGQEEENIKKLRHRKADKNTEVSMVCVYKVKTKMRDV